MLVLVILLRFFTMAKQTCSLTDPYFLMVFFEIFLFSSLGFRKDVPIVAKIKSHFVKKKHFTRFIKGKLLLKQVVTNVFKLDQINLALKLLKTGKILGRAIIRIS